MESTRDLSERETQFHAALLCVGSPPANIKSAVTFDNQQHEDRLNYHAFKAHKALLLAHLLAADYFDVYYEHVVHGARGEQLTEKAALWIGEFYRWLMEQQLDQHLAD